MVHAEARARHPAPSGAVNVLFTPLRSKNIVGPIQRRRTSARPLDVDRLHAHCAGQTPGTVAPSQSSIERPLDRFAEVCQVRTPIGAAKSGRRTMAGISNAVSGTLLLAGSRFVAVRQRCAPQTRPTRGMTSCLLYCDQHSLMSIALCAQELIMAPTGSRRPPSCDRPVRLIVLAAAAPQVPCDRDRHARVHHGRHAQACTRQPARPARSPERQADDLDGGAPRRITVVRARAARRQAGGGRAKRVCGAQADCMRMRVHAAVRVRPLGRPSVELTRRTAAPGLALPLRLRARYL